MIQAFNRILMLELGLQLIATEVEGIMSFKIKMRVLLASLALMTLVGYIVTAPAGNVVRLAASAIWGA